MHREFFTKYEYFWEYEYPFGNDFLKNIFKDNYMRKYSLVGDGIFNLILFNDKIYDISIKKGNSMLVNDGKKAFRDADKDIVVEEITKALKNKNIEYTVNSGKFITFKYNNFIFGSSYCRGRARPHLLIFIFSVSRTSK